MIYISRHRRVRQLNRALRRVRSRLLKSKPCLPSFSFAPLIFVIRYILDLLLTLLRPVRRLSLPLFRSLGRLLFKVTLFLLLLTLTRYLLHGLLTVFF